RHQFLVVRTRGVRLEIFSERGDPLVEFAKCNVTSIASQNIRLRDCRRNSHLVGVAKHEFPRLQWPLVRVAARNPRPFNRRVADPVAESERLCFSRQSMTILRPDLANSRDPLVLLASPCERRIQALPIRGEARED